VWTEAGGMVDLAAQGFPLDQPLAISPGGTVATNGFWYHLDDPGSVPALAPPPAGFGVESGGAAINDAGDQARFLVTVSGQNLAYPFRYHHEGGGSWQQISSVPTGHLSSHGIGGINDARDITVQIQGAGQIAYGPAGLAESLAGLVSPAYGGGALTDVGPVNAGGAILAKMIIGQSGQRLVRLAPGEACTADCIRVANIQLKARGPASCSQGQAQARATLSVVDEVGNRLPGATVTAHFFDDYWLDETVVGHTNLNGQVTLSHVGPPCVGAIAILVTNATSTLPERTLDRTTGILTKYAIPVPN
jgi:hypothetical protein